MVSLQVLSLHSNPSKKEMMDWAQFTHRFSPAVPSPQVPGNGLGRPAELGVAVADAAPVAVHVSHSPSPALFPWKRYLPLFE